MKAIVDQDTCIGCELCVEICPDVFRMEAGKSVVYATPVSAKAEKTCIEAKDACPVTAISVES